MKIEGDNLTLDDFKRVVFDFEKVEVSKEDLERIKEQRKRFEKIINRGVFYGVNTGFGENASIRISMEAIDRIQKNIVMSHSAGVGEFLNPYHVRGTVLLRLNSLLNLNSGVREEVIISLISLLNSNLVPCVRRYGSVGASGDLAPLSEIACFLTGDYHQERVFIFRDGRWHLTSYEDVKGMIPEIQLKAKEGLALINGTQATTSIGVINLIRSKKLLKISNLIFSLTADVMRANSSFLDERLLKLKKHKGPVKIGEEVREFLQGSRRIDTSSRVQDPYSIRCYPQVAGAIYDNLEWVETILVKEMNSVSDNPVMIEESILSGGNFHAEPVGFALELLNMSMVELGNISERRSFLMMNPARNKEFPPFMAEIPGEMSGFMIAQYTAASLASYNKTLAMPSIVDTIPTSAGQEDHVSMAYNSALRGERIIENLIYILAIELLIALQGAKFIKGEGLGRGGEELYKKLNERIPFYRDHVQLNVLIEEIKKFIEKEISIP